MENFIVQIRPYIEMLSFLSSIVLAGIAAYGIKQIRLMKSDMKSRSERAAKEKAIEASTEYLMSYVELDGQHILDCLKEKIPSAYKGPIGNFSHESIPAELKPVCLKRYIQLSWLPAINKLESIAATFTTGVADEQVGFQIIGRSFCGTVASHYDLIATSRREKANSHFSDIVELYNIWAPRLSKSELSAAREELNAQISQISDRHITPITPDVK